ncbi:hypothetical protein EJ04DRAFT_49998 [Polyplosphaeria fusca]|uniref:Uncharacterized protein n=1 Tax=Polyplosphaeria fusca TaxID=682080 RepID=A0A9P4QR73_9PLEO|nr:hypothetical protein EJ04DRAFT_49998 [Polyplosphaeria fusca]
MRGADHHHPHAHDRPSRAGPDVVSESGAGRAAETRSADGEEVQRCSRDYGCAHCWSEWWSGVSGPTVAAGRARAGPRCGAGRQREGTLGHVGRARACLKNPGHLTGRLFSSPLSPRRNHSPSVRHFLTAPASCDRPLTGCHRHTPRPRPSSSRLELASW